MTCGVWRRAVAAASKHIFERPRGAFRLLLATSFLSLLVLVTPWGGVALAATCDTSWASAVSGNWDDATKWTSGVPNGVNACITVAGTYTVTVRGGGNSAAGVTLGGSSGTQTLTVVGSAANGSAVLALSSQGVSSNGVLARGRLVLTTTDTNSYAFLNVSGGTLANAGTITVDPGAGNAGGRYWYGGVNNTATGTIAINETTQGNNGGPWTNSGTITIANGKGLTGVGGPFTNTGTLTNGGTFEQTGGFTWTSGTITNNGSFTSSYGTVTTGSGTLSGNPIVLIGAALSPNGTGSAAFILRASNTLEATVASGYTLTIEGTTSTGSGVLSYSANRTNNGTIHLTTTETNSYAFLNGNSFTLTNNSTITVDPGAGNAGGRFWYGGVNNTATGTIAINETTQTNGNPWTSSGTLSIAALKTLMLGGGLTVSGGTLSGGGTIAGNVAQTGGTISPGSSPGTLTIDGNYTGGRNGKVRIELNGTAPGQFDVLTITGTAVLAGTLQLVTNYSPVLGNSFTVITYASKTGKFKTITGQFLAGDIGYDVKFGATSTTLKVVNTVELQTTKTDSADPVPVGQSFFYTITVHNNSTKTATGAKVVDTLKSPLVFESVSASGLSCTGGAKVICKGSLAGGATATITIRVHGTAPATVTNVATATSSVLDSSPANNKATQKTTIVS
jgi:fibronectin-binding autotransporter adhesin